MKIKSTKEILLDTYSSWSNDSAPKLAAALAYYTVFSIAPLLMLIIGLVSLIVGEEVARGEVLGQLSSMVSSSVALTIDKTLQNLKNQGKGVLATVIGSVTLLVGATGAFAEMQDSLNIIWKVIPKTTSGLWNYFRVRILSLGMVLAIGFLLVVSLMLSALLSAGTKYLSGALALLASFWEVFNFAFSFLLITALFSAIFKILPDIKIKWSDVWRGAALTALLFTIGKTLMGRYLGNNAIISAFGAAGSLLILLIWVYYSAQIFLFGAEFTKVYTKKYGSQRGDTEVELKRKTEH